MYRYRIWAMLAMLPALAGCASSSARMAQVRDFAASAPRLDAYATLTEHYRASYQRTQPWLAPEADRRERSLDLQRQAACDDFIALHRGLLTYLHALGRLAGDQQYDLEDQIKALAGGIKAWPDSGLDDRHVQAYAGLTRLLAHGLGSRQQDQAAQALLRDGASAVSALLDAMAALLRYYDKSNDNEARIVLGMLDVEIPYVDMPQQRLLAALAKAERQTRLHDYRLWGRRHTVAVHSIAEIARLHQALLQQLDATTP